MENNNIINRIKKVQKLANSGIDGEATAAKKLLKEILEKYNISERDIIDDVKNEYSFSFKNKYELKLLINCVVNIFGSKSDIFKSTFSYKEERNKYYFEMTELEYFLLKDFFDFHRKNLNKIINDELENIITAYIHAHNIYNIDETEIKEESKLDIDKIKDLLFMSEKIKTKTQTYRKAISHGNN